MQSALRSRHHRLDAKLEALKLAIDEAWSEKLQFPFLAQSAAQASGHPAGSVGIPQAGIPQASPGQPQRGDPHVLAAGGPAINADGRNRTSITDRAAARREGSAHAQASLPQELGAAATPTASWVSPALRAADVGTEPSATQADSLTTAVPAPAPAPSPSATPYSAAPPDSADPQLSEYWVSGVDGTFPELTPERLTHYYSVGHTQPFIGDITAPGAAQEAFARCSFRGELILTCSDVGDIWLEFVLGQVMMMRERGYAHVMVYMDSRDNCEALQTCEPLIIGHSDAARMRSGSCGGTYVGARACSMVLHPTDQQNLT